MIPDSASYLSISGASLVHYTTVQSAKHKSWSLYFRARKEIGEKRRRKRQGHDSDPINLSGCACARATYVL